MTIPQACIDALCCPKRLCRGDVAEILVDAKPVLACQRCGDTYPVEDGIPIMFPNAAYSADLHKRHWDMTANAKNYAKKYDGYLKKQGTPWGLYTHTSEMAAIDTLLRLSGTDLTGKAIIDAGCGNGRLLSYYPQASIKIGIDASLELLKEAKKREPGFWFVCGQLEDMPFKDCIADFCVSIRVFQHLRTPEDAFTEMTRVTKPSGQVSLEVYNKLNLKEVYKRIRMMPFLNARKPWGLAYDRYFSYREIMGWAQDSFVRPQGFCGAGWGVHFYLFDLLKFRAWPDSMQKQVLDFFLGLERIVSAWPFFSVTLEKISFIGSVQARPPQRTLIERASSSLRRRQQLKQLEAFQRTLNDRNYCFVGSDMHHLRLSLDWLKAAQDATPDAGVSRAHSLVESSKANRFGWQPSYPETTGYLIPTFIAAAERLNDPDLLRRACLMADWEMSVMLPSGGVHGGNIGEAPNEAVFDTGQVIRGFLATYRLTAKKTYLQQAIRAADWMLSQESTHGGRWEKSNASSVSQVSTAYNIYAVAPLLELADLTGNENYKRLAERTVAYTTSLQKENGWLSNCDFEVRDDALLHTIAYAIDGLWDVARHLHDEAASLKARRALDGVLSACAADGSIPGRLDATWKGTVDWLCLTGMAQTAVTCIKVHAVTGDGRYLHAATQIKNKLKACQNNISREVGGGLGAVWGSWPIDGDYGRHQALNWAAKYFADVLIASL